MANDQQNLTSSTSTDQEIEVLYVTASVSGADWHSIAHSHYFSELLYVVSGSGKLIVENKEIDIRKDDLVLINPNISHTERTGYDTNEPLSYIAIGIEGLSFVFEDNFESNTHNIINCFKERDLFLSYLNTMVTETKTKKSQYSELRNHLFRVFLITLFRFTKYNFQLSEMERVSPECNLVKSYIDSNFDKIITLDMLADMVHLNKYYLSHSFIKAFGVSPINYLIEQRLRCSKDLLITTNHSIGDIAVISGFSSQSYFAQCFKKRNGISPGRYRSRAQDSIERKQ